jgi:glutamine synthetase
MRPSSRLVQRLSEKQFNPRASGSNRGSSLNSTAEVVEASSSSSTASSAPQSSSISLKMAASTEDYSYLPRISNLERATEDDLRQVVHTFPVIDNHAHNMLLDDHAYGNAEYPFECITSEAQGSALTDHVHSGLAHMRAIKQLSRLFDCPETLQDVKAARYEWVRRDYDGMVKKCLEGTHAIMMDDGLQPEIIHPFKWHEQHVPTVKRIVRIEAVAAELLEQLSIASGFLKVGTDADWPIGQTEAFLMRFNTQFRNQIRTFANDPEVRGFKSVICYRTGLDIGLESRKSLRPQQSLTESSLLTAFHDFIQQAVRDSNYRVEQKEVNDYLVCAVCEVLEKRVEAEGEGLPFQFHTGLGDTDINLVKSNPAYMQPIVEAFPNVDFVMLHSSYPYTREAGYMAANYANAWLDIGEVFPMLSREGEEAVLRQALELTPTSKILWSTDGHFFPETYWLANKQFRDVLEKILVSYVREGDIKPSQAINIATDIMFWNSDSLYKLDEGFKYPRLLQACGRSSGESQKTLVNGTSKAASIRSHASTTATLTGVPGSGGPHSNHSRGPSNLSTTVARPSTPSPGPSPSLQTASQQNLAILDAFLTKNPEVRYIWLQFLDYTGTLRNRMVTVSQFKKQLLTGQNPGITSALPRLLQDDNGAPGTVATGQFLLLPDLSTLTVNKGIPSPSASIQNWWMEDTSDIPPTKHEQGCPRWNLQRQVNLLKDEYNINIVMGCEIEIIFMRPVLNANGSEFTEFEPLHMVHSWSNMTYQQIDALPVVEEIVESLAEVDIHLPQFHSEAAPGQWEFPLPPFEPIKAIDTLYTAREIIRNVAKKHGLKATVYPRPYNFTCGSANHTHFSINGPEGTVEKYQDPFLAGILEHLPSILALTLPLEESYERVTAGIWAGGEYVTWGSQNREVPLRKCGPGHWELKACDGIGNMYLGMAALLACGLAGLREEMKLTHKDCTVDASLLSKQERAELGITTMLPHSLEESLACLKEDDVIREALGDVTLTDYCELKEAEMKKLRGFGEEKRRLWLMARY